MKLKIFVFIYSIVTLVGYAQNLHPYSKNEKWGYINNEGKIAVPLQYEQAYRFYNGFASVKLNEKYGLIDETGKVIIPILYDECNGFSEGLASVKKNDKWGFIDKS